MKNEGMREFYVVVVGKGQATGFGKFETPFQPNSDEFNNSLNSFVSQLLGNGVEILSMDLF